MIRFLDWFSIERTTGLVMLVTSILLYLRPFATATEVFEDAGLVTITLSLLRGTILIGAIYLIWRGVVRRLTFVICLMPMLLYAIALTIIFLFRFGIGPIGPVFGLWACSLSIYVHFVRPRHIPSIPVVESDTNET